MIGMHQRDERLGSVDEFNALIPSPCLCIDEATLWPSYRIRDDADVGEAKGKIRPPIELMETMLITYQLFHSLGSTI